MSTPLKASSETGSKFDSAPVNVRVKISALWTAMLFVFVYVDLFSLYRPDVRADIASGQLAGFTINEAFLVGTTVFILVPSLVVALTLVLRPATARLVNIAVGSVYAIPIVVGAIGEWNYYVLGSAVEVALIAAIVYHAVTWPRTRTAR